MNTDTTMAISGTAGVILAVWLLVGIAGGAATVWLVLRVWDRRKRHSLAVKAVAAVVVAGAVFGAFGTLAGGMKAFGAVGGESVDPSQKARILAEGISEAMNCTAFGLVVWLPSMLVAVVLLREVRQSRD